MDTTTDNNGDDIPEAEEEAVEVEPAAADDDDDDDEAVTAQVITGDDDAMETDDVAVADATVDQDDDDDDEVKSDSKRSASTDGNAKGNKKRSKSPDQQHVAAVSVASAVAAAQVATSLGLHGLSSLLASSATAASSLASSSSAAAANAGGTLSTSSSAATAVHNLPTAEQVHAMATKHHVQECPPFVHLSKTDSAPQLKLVDDRRLTLKGGMRGYRMSRATHGVSSGNYYYEVLILDPPPVSEIVDSLPPNARLGKVLQQQLQDALKQQEIMKKSKNNTNDNNNNGKSNNNKSAPLFGGHIRLGWSMRTGDLQAPVGYDKWSFGIRDIGGSKIHCSKRDDHWGGEEFGSGDVVGCAICLSPSGDDGDRDGSDQQQQNNNNNNNTSNQQDSNQIRFFKNGHPMGHFVISKGKREGGAAFDRIPDGVYYPAISLYMGASCKVNFGPHFIYQPRKLPAGIKVRPVSDLCAPPPLSVAECVAKVQKEKTLFRGSKSSDMMTSFQELVRTEAQIVHDAYNNHRIKHIQEVRQERVNRNLSISDLEDEPK